MTGHSHLVIRDPRRWGLADDWAQSYCDKRPEEMGAC